MAKLPCIHLYPGDWLRDAVAGCSLAAQGLWLRMMFIGHDSDRYGYLESNGYAMQAESIARRVGCSLPEFESLLSELTIAGVPSRTPDGSVIFSRRMVKDARLREVRSEAGKLGGRPPKYSKQNVVTKKSKPKAKTKQNIEDEDEIESVFEILWSKYPNKDGKKEALKHFHSSVKNSKDIANVKKAVDNYLQHLEINGTTGKFVKNGSTFFNNWSDWVDWKEPPVSRSNKGNRLTFEQQKTANTLEAAKRFSEGANDEEF